MNLLEMEDRQIVDKLVRDFDKAETARKPYEEIWKNNYRQYKNKVDKELKAKKQKDGKACLFIPYIWPIVEQLKARTVKALFSKRPYWSYAGNEEQDVEGAKLMEELVDFQSYDKIKIKKKFTKASTGLFLYGTIIALYEWKYEQKKIKQRQPIIDPVTGIKTSEQVVEVDTVMYDDPNIEFYPVDDFYPDPEGDDINNCGYVCTRVWRDEAYLRQKEKEEKYKLPDKIEASGIIPSDFRLDINNIQSIEQSERKREHELITYYTPDYKIVMLNRKHIIYKEENELYSKEIPFKRIVAIPLEKEFWGYPIVDALSDLQDELNTTRNQRIDNVSLILNKVWKKRRGADIDIKDIKSASGHVIEVDDINADLGIIEMPDVTGSAYQEEQIIKQDMQYISGVSEFSRGATPQRKETATTVVSLQDAANTLFNYITETLEDTGLIELGDALKKLNQQYMDKDKILRIWDDSQRAYKYPIVTPDRITGDYDVVSVSPRLEAQANKEVRREQLIEMFKTFISNPVTAQYINIPEFMKELMSQYDIKDFEKFIVQQQPSIPQNIPIQGGGINGL